MLWKNWPSWIRGAMVALIVTAPFLKYSSTADTGPKQGQIVLELFVQSLLWLIPVILVGLVLGLIYGNFKKKGRNMDTISGLSVGAIVGAVIIQILFFGALSQEDCSSNVMCGLASALILFYGAPISIIGGAIAGALIGKFRKKISFKQGDGRSVLSGERRSLTKPWPYWLKGAIIGVALYLTFVIVTIGIVSVMHNYISSDLREFLGVAILAPGIFLGKCALKCVGCGFIYCGIGPWTIVINMAIAFILGAISGWLYGRKKYRSSVSV